MEANAKRAARAEDMIRAYGTPLLRLCSACLGDVSLAEDAVQDTFLKAYRHLDAFSAQSAKAEKAWLCRIAVNTCRDYMRSAWMRRTVRGEGAAALIDRAAAPEDIGLTEAIFSLPLKPREALLLRYYQNFSVEEIARILRVPRPTVYARLSRAKKLLNDALGGDWDG